MRVCSMCRRCPRTNDPMGHVQITADSPLVCTLGIEAGTYHVCGECLERVFPQQKYSLHVGPQPKVNLTHTNDERSFLVNNRYCGLCLCYAREDDEMAIVRVVYDDFQPQMHLGGREVEEGSYRCCSECLEAARPAIYARWLSQGVIAANFPAESFTHRNLS